MIGKIKYVLEHSNPFPVNPTLQAQSKAPVVRLSLVQSALISHRLEAHGSGSVLNF